MSRSGYACNRTCPRWSALACRDNHSSFKWTRPEAVSFKVNHCGEENTWMVTWGRENRSKASQMKWCRSATRLHLVHKLSLLHQTQIKLEPENHMRDISCKKGKAYCYTCPGECKSTAICVMGATANMDKNESWYLPMKSSWSGSLSNTSTSSSWPGTSWTITWHTDKWHMQ